MEAIVGLALLLFITISGAVITVFLIPVSNYCRKQIRRCYDKYYYANRPETIDDHHARVHEYQHREDEKKFWRHSISWSIATFIVAGIAVIIAKNTFDDAHEALIAVQRAFVFIKSKDNFLTASMQGANKVWQTGNLWENQGSTSTKDLTFQIICVESVKQVHDPLRVENDAANGSLIAKGEPFSTVLGPHQNAYGGACRFPKEIVAAAQVNKVYIYIISIAKYNDIFGQKNRHKTEFCSMMNDINGDATNFSASIPFDTITCDTHNCADDQCEDE